MRVRERRGRHVAEQADLAVLGREPPHHLHAAEHHQIVDRRHQPAASAWLEEIVRREQRAVVVAQPRQRLVVAHLALRQRDDRLEDRGRRDWLRSRARAARRSPPAPCPRNGPLGGRAARSGAPGSAALGRVRRARPARRRERGARTPRAGARRRRVADRAFQHLLVRRDRVGEFLHQLAELVDLGGERLGGGARAVHARPRRRPPSRRGGGRARRPGGRCRRCRARGRRSAPPTS